ncbi:MAG: response regulator [Gammaproteobacteria bacterium]|nr:response regulator [Gammaproteobacteria bacterium]MCF6363820.1 response regulator [Gammaproteobacteria bacterium]
MIDVIQASAAKTVAGDVSCFRILIADDIETNRNLLCRRLGKMGFRLSTANNGLEVLESLAREPVDLLLLDLMMPAMGGIEVLQRMRQDVRYCDIPVIMITANDDEENAVRCIDMGAEDYLVKPVNYTMLRARVNACLERKRLRDQEVRYRGRIKRQNDELEERVHRQVREISESQLATIFAMSKLAESRDPETGKHLERMREYCRLLSRQLGRTATYHAEIDEAFVDNIYAASPLHDIGKVGVDDAVLLKPGKLTEGEWVLMRRHPVLGADTLREVDHQHPGNSFIRIGIDIAESHHEKWDGSGYPYGKRKKEIPLVGRILALGDVYDALTSQRCYKKAFSHERSRLIIEEGEGRHFDPDVVQAFREVETEFLRVRQDFQDAEV